MSLIFANCILLYGTLLKSLMDPVTLFIGLFLSSTITYSNHKVNVSVGIGNIFNLLLRNSNVNPDLGDVYSF